MQTRNECRGKLGTYTTPIVKYYINVLVQSTYSLLLVYYGGGTFEKHAGLLVRRCVGKEGDSEACTAYSTVGNLRKRRDVIQLCVTLCS